MRATVWSSSSRFSLRIGLLRLSTKEERNSVSVARAWTAKGVMRLTVSSRGRFWEECN
jgi:hypothetical protein